jgi:hypothetical protein
MNPEKDVVLKISVMQTMHFTAVAWQKDAQSTIVNSFRNYNYRHDNKTDADLDGTEQDDASQKDGIRLGGENNVGVTS